MQNQKFEPFVPAKKKIAEVTIQSILLGIILAVIMCAANAYLGLYAGMTVSASIPAAVISMAILRGILKRGTILENNIVQSIASAGESIAAGIIFTVPALVIIGAWHKFQFWPIFMISVCGGLLGIVFMVPLRRVLIVEEEELVYPEGVACAEVLIAGESGGSSILPIAYGLGLGSLFKFFTAGFKIFKGSIEVAESFMGRIFVFGSDLSPALFAVGYIIRLQIAVLVAVGGAIGWLVGIPLMSGDPIIADKSGLDAAWFLWSNKIRYIGVGAMIIGGIWSIIGVRNGIAKSVKRIASGFSEATNSKKNVIERTDQDMKLKHILIVTIVCVIGTFFLYHYLTKSIGISFFTTAIMIVSSFFLVAVSSYIVGLVGSSNNPVSGMVICTLLGTAGLFLLFGLKGNFAIVATLGVAGVACCAAVSAADISQDLKTGYLVGATPRKMQWAQMLGVIFPAMIMPPILTVLNNAYGIGTGLKAPQATLFASIVDALFGEKEMPWDMVYIGMGIGIALIIADEILKRSKSNVRTYVMPVAVGIYLPLSLSTPIFLGGLLRFFIERHLGAKETETESIHDYGVLMSSGLIAGESIMGIIIAALITAHIGFPFTILQSNWISIVSFACLIIFFYIMTVKHIKKSRH